MAALLARRCSFSWNKPTSLRTNHARFYSNKQGNEGMLYAEQRADLLRQWGVYEWAQDGSYEARYGTAAPLPPAAGSPVHAVVLDRQGGCRSVQLNRRAAGNVLSAGTQRLLAGALVRHGHEVRTAHALLVRARLPGPVCLGNDPAELLAWLRAGAAGRRALQRHAHDQLQLANALADLPLPAVAWLNGPLAGAGGLLLHASHVVATELAELRAADVHHGWLPDAGRTHLLANAPQHAGFYAALTGRALAAGDLLQLGLARFAAAPDAAELVEQALGELAEPHYDAVHAALKAAHAPLPAASLDAELLQRIDAAFDGAESLEQVLARLQAQDTAWSLGTCAAIRRGCPLTARLTFELLRGARGGGLKEALEREHAAVARLLEHERVELLEGLQARLEQAREPRWAHARLEDVRPADLAPLLRPLPADAGAGGFFAPWRSPLLAASQRAVEQMAAALDQVPRLHALDRIATRLDQVDEQARLWPGLVEAASEADLLDDLPALLREGFVAPFPRLTLEQASATFALEHGLDPWSGTEPALGGVEWLEALQGPHAGALQRLLEYQEDDDEGTGAWAERAQMQNEDAAPPAWSELPDALTDPLAELARLQLLDPAARLAPLSQRPPRPDSRAAHADTSGPNLSYY